MTSFSYWEVLKKCLDFSGKTGRRECGLFLLYSLFIFFSLDLVDDNLINIKIPEGNLKLLSTAFMLMVLLPLGALFVRRLRDVNKSAWWLLAGVASLGLYSVNFYFFDVLAFGGWWLPYASFLATLLIALGTFQRLSFWLFSLEGLASAQVRGN